MLGRSRWVGFGVVAGLMFACSKPAPPSPAPASAPAVASPTPADPPPADAPEPEQPSADAPPPTEPTEPADGAAAADPAPEREDFEERYIWIHAFLGWERLGDLRPGADASAVLAAFGEPTTKGEIVDNSDTSGGYFQEWSWPAKGVAVTVTSEAERLTDPTVSSVRLSAGSSLKTRLGVGVGSPTAEMVAAYGKYANADSTYGPYLAIGVEWTWLTFESSDGEVVRIAFGLGEDPPSRDE